MIGIPKKLLNRKINIDDTNREELIYGPATALLQGEIIIIQPKGTKFEWITLPFPISQYKSNIQQYMDLFNFNGHTFLHKQSGKVDLLSDQACTSMLKLQTIKALDTVIKLYQARGSKFTAFHGKSIQHTNT